MIINITGSSGFVGQNLIPYLKKKNYGLNSVSLRDNEWKQKIDAQAQAIIHLAGKAHDTSNTANSEEYFKVNLDLTIEVFQEFLKSEIQDFFFFSSVKAVADTVKGELTEEVKPNPKTSYGKSKQEAEEYLLAQRLPANKRLFIIRPCMIHGPGNKGNLNLLYKLVDKGIPWPLTSYENRRSFLSIENLCYLIYQLLIQKNVPSGVYNFSDDESLSTNKLIRIIAQASGKQPRYWRVNKNLIENLARLGDNLHLPLNSERLKKLTENYVVSNTKIKQALEIEFLPISTEEGMYRTIQSFKKQ